MNSRNLVLVLLGLTWAVVTAVAAEHTKDSLDTVKQNLAAKKAVLVDVRETGEWNRGHLADAQLFPLSELKNVGSDPAIREKLGKTLAKDRIVYCHCAKGVRALTAGESWGRLSPRASLRLH